MSSTHWRIVFALMLAEIAGAFESSMVYAALPSLLRHFGDPVLLGWLVTGYSLVATAACIVIGRLGQRYGIRLVIVALLLLSAAGSLISATSVELAPVLFGRALQGLAAGVLPLCIGLVHKLLPESHVPLGIGLITSAASGGVAAGLVLGGIIVDNFDWHTMFAASAGLLVTAAVAVHFLAPTDAAATSPVRMNVLEALLPVLGVTTALLGLSFSKQWGWTDPRTLALLSAGIAIIGAWARQSLRSSDPFIDLRLLGERNVLVANAVSILLAIGTMQIVLVFSTYLQAPRWTAVGLGLSATVAGLVKLPSNGCSLFAGPFAGWLIRRASVRTAILWGTATITLAWLAATTLPQSLAAVTALLCVISFGTTMLFAALSNAVVDAVPGERASEVVGSMTVIRNLSMAVGSQVVALMLATETLSPPNGGTALPGAGGFVAAMSWIALASAGAFAVALFYSNRGVARTVARPA